MSMQTALIVDDSKLARITLQRLLEKRNFQVKMAESAKQALELLQNDLPDIIFMDHLMPEIDGFEAMKLIKSNPSTQHIPVVMCTGKEGVGAGDYDQQAKAIGAAATLSKPPDIEQLNRVLAETESKKQPAAVSQPTAAFLEEVPQEPAEIPEKAPPEPAPISAEAPREPVTISEEVPREPVTVSAPPAAPISIEELLAGLETRWASKLSESLAKQRQELTSTQLPGLREEVLNRLEQRLAEATQEFRNALAAQPSPSDQQWVSEDQLNAVKADVDSRVAGLQAASADASRQLLESQQSLIANLQQRQDSMATELLQNAAQIKQLAGEWAQSEAALPQDVPSAAGPELEALQQAFAQQQSSVQDLQEQQQTLHRQFMQFESRLDSLNETLGQVAATPAAPTESGLWQQPFEGLKTNMAQLQTQLEAVQSTVGQWPEQLSERLATFQAQQTKTSPEEAPIGDLKADVERQLEDMDSHWRQQFLELQANLEMQVNELPAETPALSESLYAEIAELRERLGFEISELRGELLRGSATEHFQETSQLEQRATEAAVSAVEETLDALIAHKAEQLHNSLMLEIKAQVRNPGRTDTDTKVSAAPSISDDDIRRIAHEAVSDELDQASEHLVMGITEALRQQVDQTQQEIISKQEMFEQERSGLRKQIRSLKSGLWLVSGSAAVLAVVAIVLALSR